MSLQPKAVNFESSWKEISTTLSAVITCGKVARRTWNDRFSDVYALCVASPEPLHHRLYAETKLFLENRVRVILAEIRAAGEENLLTSYYKHWEEYSKGSQYINFLYGYLNQQFVKRNKPPEADFHYSDVLVDMKQQLLEIGELAYDVWKTLLIEPIQKNIVEAVLEEIHRDRTQNSTTNQGVIHSVIHSLVTVDEQHKPTAALALYKDGFEKRFLETTSDYYKQKASEFLSEFSCCEYLEKAIHLLNDENMRSRKYIHPSSYKLVTMQVEERLASDHLDMLHGECKELVQNENTKDLANMYTLLRPIKALGPLCEELESHIKKSGLRAIDSMTQDNIHQQFVEAMLSLHSRYSQMVRETFNNDQQFIAVLDKACAAVINYKMMAKHHCRSPELLVKYCDGLLRKSAKGVSEADVEEKLNKSITVFKYLADKDIYQAVYQRMLCKRLIYRLSASMDAEEAMINRLKQTCGYEFTNKLHRMFTDMNISTDLTNKFVEDCKDKDELKHNFSILVLQAGAWPISSQKMPTFQLPTELEHSLQSFEGFYERRFSGRKLSWVHSYSTGELKLAYLKKPYYVTLGLFQMAILLQFNDCLTLSTEEMIERTKLQDKDWPRHVSPLVDSKLLLVSDGKYSLNMEYTNKRTKFKIVAVVMKETPQETERVRQATDEDRKWQIQAAIVRIMKARKLFRHNLLIEEVIKQLKGRFSPSIAMIKKSIEALIEKQYIERTQNSKDEYSYIA